MAGGAFSLARSLRNLALVCAVHLALLHLLAGRNMMAALLSADSAAGLGWILLAAAFVLIRFITLVCLPGFLVRCLWLAVSRRRYPL